MPKTNLFSCSNFRRFVAEDLHKWKYLSAKTFTQFYFAPPSVESLSNRPIILFVIVDAPNIFDFRQLSSSAIIARTSQSQKCLARAKFLQQSLWIPTIDNYYSIKLYSTPKYFFTPNLSREENKVRVRVESFRSSPINYSSAQVPFSPRKAKADEVCKAEKKTGEDNFILDKVCDGNFRRLRIFLRSEFFVGGNFEFVFADESFLSRRRNFSRNSQIHWAADESFVRKVFKYFEVSQVSEIFLKISHRSFARKVSNTPEIFLDTFAELS